MFSSDTISREMNFLLPNQNTFKHNTETSSREFIDSDFFQNQQQQQQHGNGLARYRSAPSSFFAALLESGDESEPMFSDLLNGPPPPRDLNQTSGANNNNNGDDVQYGLKQESGFESETRPGFSNGQMGVVGSYSSMGMDTSQVHHVRGGNGNGNGNSSSLLRQSSSPAGFLNGFSVMGEVGNYKLQNHLEPSSSGSGMNNQMNFSSGPSSSLRFMPSIPESGNENVGTLSPENGRLRNGNTTNGREFEAPAFSHDSWNEPSYNNLKRNVDGDLKMFSTFSGLDNQNGDGRKRSSGLVHHLSMPKTSSEMANAENLLQFQQDVVPCQIRAKRGFATHPRSIAERMRRTRISEKMKKLQDLFPNMDKQTNTAEMLDLAVEYIKDLQKQVLTLTDTRAKCICSNKN